METNKIELTLAQKKLLSAKLNKKLKGIYDDLCGELDVETFDFKAYLHKTIDDIPMIPIPDYGVEINAYDAISSMLHVLAKDHASLLRKIIVQMVFDAIDNGYVVTAKSEETENDEE